jgi:PAS domain S-box-containing protein
MGDANANDELPEQVLRLMGRLERFTGKMSVTQAVSLIVLTGALVTTLITGPVWLAEQHRQQASFESEVRRWQTQLQDRLDYRALMLHQMASMAWLAPSAQASGDVAPAWLPPAAVILPGSPGGQMDWPTLTAGWRLAPDQVAAIHSCLSRDQRGVQTRLCDMGGAGADELGVLAAPLPTQGGGWLLWKVAARDVLPVAPRTAARWQLTGRFVSGAQLHGPTSGPYHMQLTVTLAGQPMAVSVMGTPVSRSLSEQTSQWMGVAAAGVAGLIFTLSGIHVYLMLISTRRRAREMARDMNLALQRTQSRNQVVMDTAPDAIVMTDAHGRVSWCNQATTSIFGRTTEDLMGHAVSEVLPSLGHSELTAWFEQHGFSNRVIGFETVGLRNDGSTAFPVSVSASRAELDGEWILTFIVRDTTDAKWAEQELLLRDRAISSSADGVVIVSMTLPNSPIIYVNHAFEEITGYEAHEALGMNCRFLQGSDTDQPAIEVIRKAVASGEACHVVLRNYRKNGTMFYNELALSPVANAEGQITHYVGVQTDITERIAAEQVLHLRTERLNAVFDLSPDGFVVLDKRGEVSIVNPSFERMTGLMAGDLVGLSRDAFEEQLMVRCHAPGSVEAHAAGIIPASDGDDAQAVRREVLQMHTPCPRTLVRSVRQGGHDNETVMYFRDITHELEVDRMKSEFLAMAAHELRTPMVSIFGFTELLLKRQFNDERRNDMLGTIHRQASVLINLVNELLDLARIEARRGKDFKRVAQPLQPLVQAVIDGLLVHNDSRKVMSELPAEPIWVDVDTEKLSQALTNVLSNAYKYSPHGGEIELDVVWRDRDGRLEAGMRVTDHGIGMTQEQLSRVFERFYRADTSGNIPGTGLGMTIVKEIVELHGGQVSINSEHGVGTTVTLWVPVRPEAAALASQVTSEPAEVN